jgi:hypothetical protein
MMFSLLTVSVAAFIFMLAFLQSDGLGSILSADVAYQGVQTFIIMSISGVFIYQQIDDHKTHRRHMLRICAGVSNLSYYAA